MKKFLMQPTIALIFSLALISCVCCITIDAVYSETVGPYNSTNLAKYVNATNNKTVIVGCGILAKGVPRRLLEEYEDANVTLFRGRDRDFFELNYTGIEELAALLVDQDSEHEDDDLVRRADSVDAMVTKIVDRLASMYKVSSPPTEIFKRAPCHGGYWRCFTDSVRHIIHTIYNSLRSNLKEHTLTPGMSLVGDLSRWISQVKSSGSSVKARPKKNMCNGGYEWLKYKDSVGTEYTYWVGYAPWTTYANCDTDSPESIVQFVREASLKEVSQREGTAWCFSVQNGETWHIDIRIVNWEETKFCVRNGWGIPCAGGDYVPNLDTHD